MREGKQPAARYREPVVKDLISRRPKSAVEVKEISQRLHSATTKAYGQGTECKPYEVPQTPGEGLKACPRIQGLDTRFSGRQRVSSAHAQEVTSRLYGGGTAAWRGRCGKQTVLLYPERTLVMASEQNRELYHEQQLLPKQNTLSRREKWFM